MVVLALNIIKIIGAIQALLEASDSRLLQVAGTGQTRKFLDDLEVFAYALAYVGGDGVVKRRQLVVRAQLRVGLVDVRAPLLQHLRGWHRDVLEGSGAERIEGEISRQRGLGAALEVGGLRAHGGQALRHGRREERGEALMDLVQCVVGEECEDALHALRGHGHVGHGRLDIEDHLEHRLGTAQLTHEIGAFAGDEGWKSHDDARAIGHADADIPGAVRGVVVRYLPECLEKVLVNDAEDIDRSVVTTHEDSWVGGLQPECGVDDDHHLAHGDFRGGGDEAGRGEEGILHVDADVPSEVHSDRQY